MVTVWLCTRNFNDLKTKTMTPEQIAKKYVHGMHDALTDGQEIKDMITDIENYAKEYHKRKLKLLGIGGVSGSLHCPKCNTVNVVEEDNGCDLIWCYECEKCYDR